MGPAFVKSKPIPGPYGLSGNRVHAAQPRTGPGVLGAESSSPPPPPANTSGAPIEGAPQRSPARRPAAPLSSH